MTQEDNQHDKVMALLEGALDADEEAGAAEVGPRELVGVADRLMAYAERDAGAASGFEGRMRKALENEKPRHVKAGTRGWAKRWVWSGAAAAGLIFGVTLWMNQTDRAQEPVAWAEVMQAMNRVSEVHMTLVIQRRDLSTPTEPGKVMYGDIYYQAPGKWRGTIGNIVQIHNGREMTTFNTKARKKITPGDEGYLKAVPKALVDGVVENDLLTGVMKVVFDGAMPKAQPVNITGAGSDTGIEVFDYSHDAKEKWARVWVLKQSRLPIQIKVYEVRNNEFMLFSFDYADKQRAEFFDARAFERAMPTAWNVDELNRLGVAKIDGKPVAPEQVRATQADLKPAIAASGFGTPEGEIGINTNDPGNKKRMGGALWMEGFVNVKDNWGNRYVQTGNQPAGGGMKWFFAPVSGFKKGEGERVVTLSHRVRGTVRTADPSRAQVEFDILLWTGEVPVGFGTAESDARGGFWSGVEKERAIDGEIWHRGTLLEQWRRVQTRRKQEPGNEAQFLGWAYKVLKEAKRDGEADALMKERMLPLFETDVSAHVGFGHDVSEYLARRFEEEGIGAVQGTIDRLNEQREKFKALPWQTRAMSESQPSSIVSMLERGDGMLRWLMELPEGAKGIDKAARPRVVQVLMDDAGRRIVQIQLGRLTTMPEAGPVGMANDWVEPNGLDARGLWRRMGIDDATGTLTIELEPVGEAMKSYTVFLRARAAQTKRMTWVVRRKLECEIDLSSPIRIESVDAWWAANVPVVVARKMASPIAGFKREAQEALDGGEYAKAARLAKEALAVPASQWEKSQAKAFERDLMLSNLEDDRFGAQTIGWKARLGMGEMDGVFAEIDALEKGLPGLGAMDGKGDLGLLNKSWGVRGRCMEVKVFAVRMLVKAGKLDDARGVMRRMGKARGEVREGNWDWAASGSEMEWARMKWHEMWRGYEAMEWEMEEGSVAATTDGCAEVKSKSYPQSHEDAKLRGGKSGVRKG